MSSHEGFRAQWESEADVGPLPLFDADAQTLRRRAGEFPQGALRVLGCQSAAVDVVFACWQRYLAARSLDLVAPVRCGQRELELRVRAVELPKLRLGEFWHRAGAVLAVSRFRGPLVSELAVELNRVDAVRPERTA